MHSSTKAFIQTHLDIFSNTLHAFINKLPKQQHPFKSITQNKKSIMQINYLKWKINNYCLYTSYQTINHYISHKSSTIIHESSNMEFINLDIGSQMMWAMGCSEDLNVDVRWRRLGRRRRQWWWMALGEETSGRRWGCWCDGGCVLSITDLTKILIV